MSQQVPLKRHLRTSKRRKGTESDNSCAGRQAADGAREGAIGVLSASQECHINVIRDAVKATFGAIKATESDGKRQFFVGMLSAPVNCRD